MSSFGGRHTEFFGPDFARGPFASSRVEVAALQIATQLAQLRAPLERSDAAIESHAEFIVALAEKLAPDFANAIRFDVGDESANTVDTSIRTNVLNYSLLEVWLADDAGGGLSTVTPTSVTWNTGVVLAEFTTRRHYLVVTPSTGVLDVTVGYTGSHSWNLAVARTGRVYYSSQLSFS
ncbi:MAG: hypothetical protein AB7N71_08090 [Phycisphaerae bacterium]